MRRFAIATILAVSTMANAAHADNIPDYVAAAVADPARPQKDRDRDADRKPAEIVALTGVKPGDRAVDVGPGSGYYLRILSRIVGPNGKAIGFNPTWVVEKFPVATEGVKALSTAGYANVEGVVQAMAEIAFDKPVDLIFMSQVYHDQSWQNIDVAKMNKAIFNALKPGGVYFIIDHSGPGVTTVEQIGKVHRIDEGLVKQEILAAGFVLDAESNLLRNSADQKALSVFDPSIRGKTDQFVYKFKKPLK